MKRYPLILFFILLLSVVSCEKSDQNTYPDCGCDDPLNEISWLKQKKEMLVEAGLNGQIIRYKYLGEYVFMIDPCVECYDDLVVVYNCAGEVICQSGGIAELNTCPGFGDEISDSTMIFDNSLTLVCGVENPLTDLPWLRERILQLDTEANPAGYQIIRYRYHGDYVFMIDPCYGCADGLISVYNCEGEVICEFGGFAGLNTCPDFENEATDSTMLINAVNP